MRVIKLEHEFLVKDISLLPAESEPIFLAPLNEIARHMILCIEHDALSGSGGESFGITPKAKFLETSDRKYPLNVYDSNGATSGAGILITGTGSAGGKFFFVTSGAATSKETGVHHIVVPIVVLELAVTNYTAGEVRIGYMLAG